MAARGRVKCFTGITSPGLGVVGPGVAIAGLNGGVLALADPSLTGSNSQLRPTIALLVVLMWTLYAHGQGDRMGAALPRRLSLRELTKRTLSADVVELVGGRGQVRVTVAGEVGGIEGYPPLPAGLRESIAAETWAFPADLPPVELASRVEAALRTEYDLVGASVTLDGATVDAVDATVVATRSPDDGVGGIPPRGRPLAAGDAVYVVARPERIREVSGVAAASP